MSQSKISKIETGAAWPSTADVQLIAETLEADESEVERLVSLAGRPPPGKPDVTPISLDRAVKWQREIEGLEADSTVVRTFQPMVVPGLLQTGEYARAIFQSVVDLDEGDIELAIAARIKRQRVLTDRWRSFHFVMPEAMLANQLMSADDMPAQLSRIRNVARRQNVTLTVVTDSTRWPFPPVHGFTILDDQWVIIDVVDDTLVIDAPRTVRRYRDIFDQFESVATTDIEPMLQRYRRMYLDRARGSD